MNHSPSQEKLGLTREAFEKLILWLDLDRERAGEKYETIRHKLIKFFDWRGDLFPEEHADETINRVARKLREGEAIRTSNPSIYFYGVARMLFMEVLRGREREQLTIGHLSAQQPFSAKDSDKLERECECLEECLQSLPLESRELITRYHQGGGQAKIENRFKLAAQLNIPLNALRIRSHRIREKLEACVKQCLKQLPIG